MLTSLLTTDRSWPLLLQRLALGLVILPHGMQKLFGAFGGYGFEGTMRFFSSLGMPSALALLVIIAESFGALALLLGLGTRLAAFGTVATMVGAILIVHAPFGFFMNWGGTNAGEGFEFHLLAIALALPLVIRGAGRYSLDGILAEIVRTLRPASGRVMARP
jgi:putative oxidoreductase